MYKLFHCHCSVVYFLTSENILLLLHYQLCHSAQLPAWDLRSGGGQKEQECILDPSHYPCNGYYDTVCVRAGFGRVDAAF